jgi:alpha-N-arabinofuranosidase
MNFATALLALGLAPLAAAAAEIHVAVNGNDHNDGARARPFKTISAAARAAQPGDVITVHEGTYRERVNPPRGGASEAKRIVYRAAPGARVEIKGSEVITGWVKMPDDVWKVTLPNAFFGHFNPYTNVLRGDWFSPLGRAHHTGAVYLNGDWLTEAATLDEVLLPSGRKPAWVTAPGRTLNPNLWFAQVDDAHTTIWAQFPGVNPNEQLVEINVRQTVFYPDQPGRNYITVRGFTLRHAATPWAPPTAEQIGLIGTHWSKGWIIESNVVSHSICSGIALGKHGDEFDNTSANTAEGYVKTIERAHAFRIPWTRQNIGHHIVRYNTISHCEQTGIVGSLGCAFSTVTGNVIHDIHVRRLFSGAEMAGIKFHAAIDTVIRGNHIYRANMGLWLDWMAQGTLVSRNLFHDNTGQDMFVEVDHGPFVVDNNLFLSPTSLLDMSEGGAYAHNLFAGKINSRPEPGRETPYHPAHSTTVAGLKTIQGGDDRFYNNLFIGAGATAANAAFYDPKSERATGYGLWVYDTRPYPLHTGGNVYFNGARPYTNEVNALQLSDLDPRPRLVQEDGRYYLELSLPPAVRRARTTLVTTERLGKAVVPNLPYENADGSPLQIDRDYLGQTRSRTRPAAGPFESPGAGRRRIQVW